MKVLLADDHDLVRDTIVAFLDREDDIQVFQADSLDGAHEKIRESGPFDVVLLDFVMPGMNKLDGLQPTLDLNRGKPVAILSGTAPRAIAEEALSLGAAGFLPKTMTAKSLVNAVRFMAAGEKYAPIQMMTDQEDEDESPLAKKLSAREIDVLEGLCQGHSNKEIARDLGLQEVTIKLHVKTLCRKLEARNRTHAVILAKEQGF